MTNVSSGYKEDDIRAPSCHDRFRNVENTEARMRQLFKAIENQETICFWFFFKNRNEKQFTAIYNLWYNILESRDGKWKGKSSY